MKFLLCVFLFACLASMSAGKIQMCFTCHAVGSNAECNRYGLSLCPQGLNTCQTTVAKSPSIKSYTKACVTKAECLRMKYAIRKVGDITIKTTCCTMTSCNYSAAPPVARPAHATSRLLLLLLLLAAVATAVDVRSP